MKDRIGNKLERGDKVVIALPESQIFGYVAEIEEGGIITGVRGARGGMEKKPGRILISCVIALPVDAEQGAVAQIVKVYDPAKHEEPVQERPN